MEIFSKQFEKLKKKVNQNGFYLDIGCSFVKNHLEGTFLLFEKYDSSEIEIVKLIELINEFTDFGIIKEQLVTTITSIRNLFSVGWLQIFAVDVLNKNKFKLYFFEKKSPFLIENDLIILKEIFDYKEMSYDSNSFHNEFLCFGFTIDLSKKCFIENYKVYYKTIKNLSNEPYIKMFSAKKMNGFEQYNYYLCQNSLSFYKFIKNTYGINTFKDLPSITRKYALSEIQISENPLNNKKINLYYFDIDSEF